MFSLFFTVCTKYLLYSCIWSKIYLKKDSLLHLQLRNLDEIGCWHLLNWAACVHKQCSHLPFDIQNLSRHWHRPACMETYIDEAWFQLLWRVGRLVGLLQSQTPVLGFRRWFIYLYRSYRGMMWKSFSIQLWKEDHIYHCSFAREESNNARNWQQWKSDSGGWGAIRRRVCALKRILLN